MKSPLLPAILLSLVLATGAPAAVLNLVDSFTPTADPVVEGYHVDTYQFPITLLDASNPMTRLSISYDGAFTGGGHPMMNINPDGLPTPVWTPILGADANNDTHLLFDLSQILSVTGVVESSALFEATVEFTEGITAVSGGEAFRAVHGEPLTLTEVRWTATYTDGSTAAYRDGIIPEPSAGILMAAAMLAGVLRGRFR